MASTFKPDTPKPDTPRPDPSKPAVPDAFKARTFKPRSFRPPARPAHDTDLSPPALPARADIVVVGAGVIGLSIAWRLAARGRSVVVLERGQAGSGASLAASGMLAATAELEPGGLDLLALTLASQRLWPQFRDELEAAAGLGIDYRDHGTLIVAQGRDELERARFQHELRGQAGLDSTWLSGAEVRAMEPALRASVVGGLFCPRDHQVDPPRIMEALARAFRAAGGVLVEHCPVEALVHSGGRVSGVATAHGAVDADIVIVATGASSGADGLLPPGDMPPVRPLKGQALSLRMSAQPELSHVLWTEQIHLAPKSDNRLIVGATVEERGFDDTITAGAVYALLEGARRVLPAIEELEIDAIWSGWRPTSDDDAPIFGETGTDGLLLAVGHHRNGYLLAPVTAQAFEHLIMRGGLPPEAQGFGLSRFSRKQRAERTTTQIEQV